MQEQYSDGDPPEDRGEIEKLRDDSLLEITRLRMEVEAKEQQLADELVRAEADLESARGVGDQEQTRQAEAHIEYLLATREKLREVLKDLGEKERRIGGDVGPTGERG